MENSTKVSSVQDTKNAPRLTSEEISKVADVVGIVIPNDTFYEIRDDLALRKRMVESQHVSLLSRGKSIGASSDFQYDLAFLTGANHVLRKIGIDVSVFTPNFRS